MESFWQSLTNILCSYGIWAAGLFSGHGSFEETIPEKLIQMYRKNKK